MSVEFVLFVTLLSRAVCYAVGNLHGANPHLVNTSPSSYQSYLVRLWREGAQRTWRGSVQSTATKQIHHFADVEALFAFLAAQLDTGEGGVAASDEPRPTD